MAGKLEGKVAIITGGATKVGEAICKNFALEGAKVVVCGFCDDPVDKVVNEINANGGHAMGYQGDISTEIKARECVTMAVNNWGGLDILINAAGVFPGMEEVQFYPVEAFYFMMRNNIQTAFMMSRYALPELQKHKGTIIFTGADVGIEGLPKNAPYGGTKGFILAFAKGLAAEQKSYGVKVFAICDSPIDSNWISSTRSRDERKLKAVKPQTDQSIDELADTYLYLSTSGSQNMEVLFTPGKEPEKKKTQTKAKSADRPSVKNQSSGKKRPTKSSKV